MLHLFNRNRWLRCGRAHERCVLQHLSIRHFHWKAGFSFSHLLTSIKLLGLIRAKLSHLERLVRVAYMQNLSVSEYEVWSFQKMNMSNARWTFYEILCNWMKRYVFTCNLNLNIVNWHLTCNIFKRIQSAIKCKLVSIWIATLHLFHKTLLHRRCGRGEEIWWRVSVVLTLKGREARRIGDGRILVFVYAWKALFAQRIRSLCLWGSQIQVVWYTLINQV